MKQVLIALVIAAGLLGAARAETAASSGIAVENIWARATPGGARKASSLGMPGMGAMGAHDTGHMEMMKH
jgi:hypothetical protein